jgi:hypothetical protein
VAWTAFSKSFDGSVKRHDRDIVVKDEAGSGPPDVRSLPPESRQGTCQSNAEEQAKAEVLAGKGSFNLSVLQFCIFRTTCCWKL